MGRQTTAIFPTRKRRLEKLVPGSRRISKAAIDNISRTSWHTASDRGEPARDVGNDIGVRARGGKESLKRMRYPSLRTDGTQDSAPACQCLQCADRQPPTRNRGGPQSGGLLLGTLAFATGAPEKGALPLHPRRFQPCWVEEEEGAVDAWYHDRGTTVSKGSGRGPSLGWTSRRYPRNLRWMQRPVNKSVVRSHSQLVQGRVEQRRREKTRRRGKVSITK